VLKRDGSLVFFTTLSQWSVGIIVCLTGLMLLPGDKVVFAESGISLANPVFLALVLILLATTVSFLHLGNPINALKTLNNLTTSWLSREILGIGLFTLSLVVLFAYGFRSYQNEISLFVLVPASLAGLFLLWTMAYVYLLPTVPGWNSGHTPIGFAATALCLGLVTCLVFGMHGFLLISKGMTVACSTALAAVLLLETVSWLLRQRQLMAMDTGFDGPRFDRGVLRMLFLVRLGALLVATLGIAFFVLFTQHAPGGVNVSWLYPVLVLAVLQEFAGRMLFYGSYFRVGL
jgi:DMSO reductase anchor subunit